MYNRIRIFISRVYSYINAKLLDPVLCGDYIIENLKSKGAKIGHNVKVYDIEMDSRYAKALEIGDDVILSHVKLPMHDASTELFIGVTKIGKVKIGNGVFVGYESIILPGTDIGDNVIIGAGSVVRGRIPSNSVAMGNPCVVIGKTEDYVKKQEIYLKQSEVMDIDNEASLYSYLKDSGAIWGFIK